MRRKCRADVSVSLYRHDEISPRPQLTKDEYWNPVTSAISAAFIHSDFLAIVLRSYIAILC